MSIVALNCNLTLSITLNPKPTTNTAPIILTQNPHRTLTLNHIPVQEWWGQMPGHVFGRGLGRIIGIVVS